MKPDTHTFWDPEKGRYVTLGRCPKPQGPGVPTPAPTDDAEFRRKSIVAADAVVSSAMSGIMKGFLWALALVILFAIAYGWDHRFEPCIAHQPLRINDLQLKGEPLKAGS